jgi:VCBS repeat protein
LAGHSIARVAGTFSLALVLAAACGGGASAPPTSSEPEASQAPSVAPTATPKPTPGPLGSAPSFTEVASVTVAKDPGNIAVGDLDGDGALDLVMGSEFDNDVSIALGRGDGSFELSVDLALPSTDYVALADVSGDDVLDLILPSGTGVSVLMGTGDGGFGVATLYKVSDEFGSEGTFWIAPADLNGDGAVDIAASSYAGNLALLINHGDGTFADPVEYHDPYAVAVAVADFDGDGALDVATANFDSSVRVFFGAGDGTIDAAWTTYTLGGRAVSIVAGDVTEDGLPDLLTGNNADLSLSVLIDGADGTFAKAQTFKAGNTHTVALADLDADGHIDLIAGGYDVPGVVFVRGFGDGTFEATTNIDTGETHARGVAVADLNGDGRPDLAVGAGAEIHIFLGNP